MVYGSYDMYLPYVVCLVVENDLGPFLEKPSQTSVQHAHTYCKYGTCEKVYICTAGGKEEIASTEILAFIL